MKFKASQLILIILSVFLLSTSFSFAAYSNCNSRIKHRDMKGDKYYYISTSCSVREINAYESAVSKINANKVGVKFLRTYDYSKAHIIMTAWDSSDKKNLRITGKYTSKNVLDDNMVKNLKTNTVGFHTDGLSKLNKQKPCVLVLSRPAAKIASLPGNSVSLNQTIDRTVLHELCHALGLKDQQKGSSSIMLQTKYADKNLKKKSTLEKIDIVNLKHKCKKCP